MIKVFDSKNYSAGWKKFKRDSARAIIFCGENLAMIRSKRFGEYKFPGGAIEKGESHLDALFREVREETGLHIIPSSVREYGKTLVLRRGINSNEIFEQESFYYLCDIDIAAKSSVNLDAGYETNYGYSLVFVSPDEAIKQNTKRLNIPDIPWVERDLFVLCELQNGMKEANWRTC
ncbi:MAG: NUDIX domain-containing protein [Clostridiales bacterium]|jgi:8-oxo-dGTP pyrophosphatase MutT (NUDIX family)|nr:NUDIX domain-containing protein [Clostridiales bacterium]